MKKKDGDKPPLLPDNMAQWGWLDVEAPEAEPQDEGAPDDEDGFLWDFVAQTVTPLSPDKNPRLVPPTPARIVVRDYGPQKSSARARKAPVHHEPQILDSGGMVSGVDSNSVRRLRRGQMRIEARLDLHGLGAMEAEIALRDFLQISYARHRRCVLVITGKGRRVGGDREAGILRRSLPRWLSSPPLSSFVLAASNAIQEDGGSGAFYILLRRDRNA